MPTSGFGGRDGFTTVAVSGQSDIVADGAADTLTVAAGSNITLTTNASTDTLTIAASGGSPTIGDTQVAYATSANTIGGNAGFKFTDDSSTGLLTVSGAGAGNVDGDGTSGLLHLLTTDQNNLPFSISNSAWDSGGSPFAITVRNNGQTDLQFDYAGDGAYFRYRPDTNRFYISNPLHSLELVTLAVSDTSLSPQAFVFWDTTAVILTTGDGVTPQTLRLGSVEISNGFALKTDTTTAHNALFQAYDVDGTAYKTFATLTNGNTPDFTIAPPSGGTVTVQATTFKSSDGTSGATAGPFTVVSSITVKNGLVVTLTGT